MEKTAKETPLQNYSYLFPFSKIYQFRITLLETDPLVWRRIQVPGCYTFWDLHCAITDAFGWLDCHMHLFSIPNQKTLQVDLFGIPDELQEEACVLGSWKHKIAKYFSRVNPQAEYTYDFGDGWHHSVVLEKIMVRTDKKLANSYPCCIGGENACPPEDCGGTGGYQRFKKAIAYHNAEEHDEMSNWVGGWFDPDWFDMELVRFGDPHLRWEIAFRKKPIPKHLRMVQYHRMRKG